MKTEFSFLGELLLYIYFLTCIFKALLDMAMEMQTSTEK